MLKISPSLRNQICFSAEEAYPEECCGMLLGTELDGIRTIHETVPIQNEQELDRERRFLITPERYRWAEKLSHDKHLRLLGIYHSHPDHAANPSQYDTEHALPWFVYVIVSVLKKRSDRITAWILNESRQRFEEQSMYIE